MRLSKDIRALAPFFGAAAMPPERLGRNIYVAVSLGESLADELDPWSSVVRYWSAPTEPVNLFGAVDPSYY